MFQSSKNRKKSGQVSVETLVAVFVVLIFFAIVLMQASLINSSAQFAENTFSQKNSCLKLSHLISQVYTEGKGSHATYYLDYDANVFATKRIVKINEQICYFIARTNDTNLTAGEIGIDNNGIVRFV